MDNNWKTATKADRAALYHVARAIADSTNLSVEAIMEQAFGHKLMVGTDYLSNFRSGTIGRPKAKLIHAWIAEHHAETACAIDPKLFPKPHTDVWADYLEHHAIHGKLSIARFDKSMGLVQRKRDQPIPDEVLKLGEEFCFHLDSGIKGHAVAFQIHKGTVHPLPLGPGCSLTVSIKKGEQFLPVDLDAKPEMLTETDDLGSHRFVVIVNDDVKRLPTQTQFPTQNCDACIHVLKIQILP
ncbi:hypothetical protein [Halocynthiibacter styelae]|uniref:Uncharacterized protein n=1 Tax=Halocynthiibacter styelae TaxID=2761955 RepID=A0A8J7IRM1_9RHOB|nr:hypothetical protein [Paenihalocynthiibacter styelae]MBI1494211.1 hypothetical protein [Paenihalocynthiibacter styelae]